MTHIDPATGSVKAHDVGKIIAFDGKLTLIDSSVCRRPSSLDPAHLSQPLVAYSINEQLLVVATYRAEVGHG